jgi:hypothetical protein
MKATGPFTTHVASDINRDGIGIELLSAGEVVAEVFRFESDHTLTITTYNHDLPLVALESLILRARQALGPFEDGSALPEQ